MGRLGNWPPIIRQLRYWVIFQTQARKWKNLEHRLEAEDKLLNEIYRKCDKVGLI
jgi:hypothetical protein